MKEKKTSPMHSDTAYDDAFRIMEGKCDDLLLPFINYFYNENYDNTAVINRLRNERFIEHEDSSNEKRITDSYFEIIWKNRIKRYHIEVESRGYSGTILIRMFQYISSIAIDESKSDYATVSVEFPNTGLYVLRDKGNPPKEVVFRVTAPNGERLSFEAPVMRQSDFSVEDLFENRLYLMLPFFLFNAEPEFDEIEASPERIAALKKQVECVIRRINDEPEERLSQRSKGVIIRMIERVNYKLTMGHEAIFEEVGEGMEEGRVNEFQDVLDWIEKWDAAEARGRVAGEAAGEAERNRLMGEVEKLQKEVDRLQAALASATA